MDGFLLNNLGLLEMLLYLLSMIGSAKNLIANKLFFI